MLVLSLGGGNEAARVHQVNCWISSLVAAQRARTARARPPHRLARRHRGRCYHPAAPRGILQALQQLGWTDGNNVPIDYRWGGGDADRIRKNAAELAALAPDVILATGVGATEQLLKATRTVPIVFVL